MATLAKQIWISQLMENFYPDTSFLRYVKDFSNLVENDMINMAEAGVDPVVMINNTTYPITVVQRIDTPLPVELDKFETENTLVRRPEVIEYAYDQLESVIMGHRNVLRTKTGQKAAHAFAPQQDTAFSPVLATTGANDGEGNKRLTIEDVLRLKRRFDDVDYPTDKRFLVLAPRHLEDLILLDTKSFKDITDFANGEPKRFAGFNILSFSKNPAYNRTTMQKKAFGSAGASTDGFCSFAFYGEEVMKADGEVYMYATIDDPKERGTIVGFDKRFIAVPIRNKGVGAIVSAAAA